MEHQKSAVSEVSFYHTATYALIVKTLCDMGVIFEYIRAYERHIEAEQHHVGKENTQKIESKHINLRTRIKRLGSSPK